jgi:hypothetical protein
MESIRIVVISEFGEHSFDGVMGSVCKEIRKRNSHCVVSCISGFLTKYRYGGLRISRLTNYLWVYARVLVELVRYKPKVVICDTTPPLVQWWAAFLGRLFGSRIYVWLMDYHPEIEARLLDKCASLHIIAVVLRKMDRWFLRRMDGMVVLDRAMAEVIRSRRESLELKVHPTWSNQGGVEYSSVTRNMEKVEFRLAYVGNLGAAHNLGTLEWLLKEISRRKKLRILLVGENRKGNRLLADLGKRCEAVIEYEGRLGWADLRVRVSRFGPDFGLVLLNDEQGGVVSPSKYIAYLQMGLPLLYLGPRMTNADDMCRNLGAGIAITREEAGRDGAVLVDNLLEAVAHNTLQEATQVAFRKVKDSNESSFVDLVEPWLSQNIDKRGGS